MRNFGLFGGILQDLHYGFRSLRKNPAFSVVAVLSLALGIGANTAIFSLIDALLLKALPVADAKGLVFLGTRDPKGSNHNFYYETYQRIQREQPFFTELAASSPVVLNLTIDGQPEPSVPGQLVSGNYFRVLGVGAVLGRTLTPDDDVVPGGHPVATISYEYWQRQFGRSPSVLGRKILVDGTPFTIIGVTPRGFFGLEVGTSADITVPLMMQPQVMPAQENWLARPVNTVDWLNVVGRLKPSVRLQAVSAGMKVLYRRIQTQLAAELNPQWQATWLKDWAEAEPLMEPGGTGLSVLRDQFSAPLLVLMGAVGLVLLIACANVANLLLARASARQREIAVRMAIGAGRGRLIRQMLVESTLLSCLGGALGLLFAGWVSELLVHFLSTGRAAIVLDLSPDPRILGFTLLASLATGILFGLAPALRAARVDLTPALKEGRYAGSSRQRIGKVLVVSQVALSLILVIGAGLLVTSLRKLNNVDAGFDRDQVVTVGLAPEGSDQKQPNAMRLQRLYLDLQERTGAIPGVMAASLAGAAPTSTLQSRTVRTPDGRQFRTSWTQVFPRYFETLGTAMLRGRDFGRQDLAPGAAYVTVINETFARRAFPDENPIGKRILCSRDQACEVIGVVKDMRYSNLRGEAESAMYMTFLQAPTGRGQMVLHVRFGRAGGNLAGAIAQVRREVSAIDPKMPAFEIRTLAKAVDAALVRERLLAMLSTCFGVLAVVLAAIGIYGVLAYAVGRRTREIGLRIAVGASRQQVRWMVLGETLRLAGLGIALGLPMAFGALRLIRSFLFGLTASDPSVPLGSAIFLMLIAILAGYLPARRASRIDPLIALRYE